MFERFTEKARRVIFFGRYEASQFGSPYIETEHLLLGLLREDNVLNRRFLPPGALESIRLEIQKNTLIREKTSTSADLPLSNESKRVLSYASEEADRLNHKHIGTEHLLLGLLREEKAVAARALQTCGVSLEKVREELGLHAPFLPGPGSTAPIISVRFAPRQPHSAGAAVPAHWPRERTGAHSSHTRIATTPKIPCWSANWESASAPSSEAWHSASLKAACLRFFQKPPSLNSISHLGERSPAHGLKTFVPAFRRRPNRASSCSSTTFTRPPKVSLVETAVHLQEILKRVVVSGQIQCISVATPAGYAKVDRRSRLARRLLSAHSGSACTEVEALQVLRGIKHIYEEFHAARYADDALTNAVAGAAACFPGRSLPGSAVDVMDEAGSVVRLRNSKMPAETLEIQKRLLFLVKRKDAAIENHEFEKARFYADEERKERTTWTRCLTNIGRPRRRPRTSRRTT